MKYAGVIVFALVVLGGCTFEKAELAQPEPLSPSCDTSNVTFAKDIVPILKTYCGSENNSCHSNNGGQGQVYLEIYDGVAAIADPADHRLLSSITWDGKASFMPNTGIKLDDCNINKIRRWINQGYQNN